MADIRILNPESLGTPLGQYSQITRVKASEFLFIAGQLSANKAGDIIGWTATSKKTEYYKFAQANMSSKSAPGWLNVDAAQMTGRIVAAPGIAETPTKFDPAVIVEYYSR